MKKIKRTVNVLIVAIILIYSIFTTNCNAKSLLSANGGIATDNRGTVANDSDETVADNNGDEDNILCANIILINYYVHSDEMDLFINDKIGAGESDGYEIRYAKSKSYKNPEIRRFMKKDSLKEYEINGFDVGSTYYFSVRGYKKSDGTMLYGKWSDTKKFEIYKIGQPEIISVSNKGKKVSIKWKKASGSKIRYLVYVDTKEDFWLDDTKKTSTVLNCKELKKGKKFKAFVCAYVNQDQDDSNRVWCSSKTVTSKLK